MHYLSLILLWLLRLWTLALVITAILPLLPVGWWQVRVWDFPRLQLSALSGLALFLTLACWCFFIWRAEAVILGGCLLLVGGWQLSHVLPFTFIWPKQLENVAAGEKQLTRLGVMNLKFDNPDADNAVNIIEAMELDLLLLVEIDQAWESRLAKLKEKYPYQAGVVKSEGMGIMLYAKEPLGESSVRYVVSELRPSVWVKVPLKQGGQVQFVGVHPTPPGLEEDSEKGRRDSRERDAELLIIAKEIAQAPNTHWLVAGDLNDVAWSDTTQLFKRISGLKDPRVGRMLLNSYNAQSWLLRYPLDHVFMSPSFKVSELHRKYIPGSDHYGIITHVYHEGDQTNAPQADGEDHQDASEMIREGQEDAREHGVAK